MDLETNRPNPKNVCVIKVNLPNSFPIIQDNVSNMIDDSSLFMTKEKDISPNYLSIIYPKELIQKIGKPIKKLCS